MTIGKHIKELRTRKGMTQEKLGKHLGIGKAAIQKYESGQVQNLKSSHIKVLCTLFDVHPWLFIFDEDELEEAFPKKSTGLSKEHYLRAKMVYGEKGMKFLMQFEKLNEDGQERLYQFIADLAQIPAYCKKE